MSVLELKGELHDMLAQVNEESQLRQVRTLLLNFLTQKNGDKTYPDGLAKEQYEELLLAIEASEDEANLISSEVMFKRYEQWLGK
jgi:hypothetical protein